MFVIMDIVNPMTFMMPSVTAVKTLCVQFSQSSAAREGNFLDRFWTGFYCCSQCWLFADYHCKIVKTLRVFSLQLFEVC